MKFTINTFILCFVLSNEIVFKVKLFKDLYDLEDSLLTEAMIEFNIKCNPKHWLKAAINTKCIEIFDSSNNICCNSNRLKGIEV